MGAYLDDQIRWLDAQGSRPGDHLVQDEGDRTPVPGHDVSVTLVVHNGKGK
ncbi:MAG: hypothetical protein IT187_09860 [Geothrix sp.]|nr:hypothetical protein [Geothrix sp.]